MRYWIAICLLAAACEAPSAEDGPNDSFLVDGKADTGGIAEGTPDALGVLALVNSGDYTTLHHDAKVETHAAHNIVNHRLGADGASGTADDNRFDTLAELDAIPYVGPTAFHHLLAYAEAHGLVPSGSVPTWETGIPSEPFSKAIGIWFQSQINPNCYPTCYDQLLTLILTRGADSGLTVSYSNGTFPAHSVAADGTFSFTDHEGQLSNGLSHQLTVKLSGHFEPGRVIVLDSIYENDIESYYWQTESTATYYNIDPNLSPARATF